MKNKKLELDHAVLKRINTDFYVKGSVLLSLYKALSKVTPTQGIIVVIDKNIWDSMSENRFYLNEWESVHIATYLKYLGCELHLRDNKYSLEEIHDKRVGWEISKEANPEEWGESNLVYCRIYFD